jgi:hypothetical protein
MRATVLHGPKTSLGFFGRPNGTGIARQRQRRTLTARLARSRTDVLRAGAGRKPRQNRDRVIYAAPEHDGQAAPWLTSSLDRQTWVASASAPASPACAKGETMGLSTIVQRRTSWSQSHCSIALGGADRRPLALTESDLDPARGAVLVRRGRGGKRREVGMDRWALGPVRRMAHGSLLPSCRCGAWRSGTSRSGSDGTRTRDLRRDSPAVNERKALEIAISTHDWSPLGHRFGF